MKVAVAYSQDHRDHIMIGRVIDTLIKAGIDADVIDGAVPGEHISVRSYRHVGVRQWEGVLFSSVVWPVVRRFGSSWLNDHFWRLVLNVRIITNAFCLGWVAASTKPDHYVVCDLTSVVGSLFARRLFSAPILYIAFEIESEQGSGERVRVQRKALRAWESFALPKVDHLVAPNQARANFYAQRHELRNTPVVVRNCSPWHDASKSKQLHAQLGLPDDAKLVLYHGAFIPFRALDNLILSAAFFEKDTVLVMIGRQNDFFKTTLLPLLAKYHLEERVFFLPFVPPTEIMDLVASAELGVVLYENVNLNNYLCAPTKLYELIMLGVPAIVNDYPEPREIVHDYGVGVVVESTDPHAIAAAVNGFIAMTRTHGGVPDPAFARARQDLNWEHESERLINLLKNGEWL